jgi:NAD(P)-dependent dehydrogenase (short-subunit alcohol dehydrogenase family)
MIESATNQNQRQEIGLERFSLRGRKALITGASRGIGEALALALAQAGADVALCARSQTQLREIADQIEKLGCRALPLQCDVRKSAQVATCVTQAWQELGYLDILVNNAGGPVFQSPFLEMREEGWNKIVDLNLNSVFRVCQQVGRRMVERRAGSIINIASTLPTRFWPSISGYSSAKAGVINLSQNLAVEWGGAGVRVNVVCPGWIKTQLNQLYLSNPARAELAIDNVPLERWGETDDLAGVVIWLASEAARYVTGAVIPVDGGFSVGMGRSWLRQMQMLTPSERTAEDR